MTRAVFDDRVETLSRPEESWWISIRERLDTPIAIALPLVVGAATVGVERIGWIRSYSDVFLACGIVVAGATLLTMGSIARSMGAHSRRARRLGLQCAACRSLLVLPFDSPNVDPVATGVRRTGRCPNCLRRVLDRHAESPAALTD